MLPTELLLVLCFSVLSYAFETALDLRQLRVLREPRMARQLEGIVDPKKFEQARRYQMDKMALHLLQALVSFAQNLATLLLGLLPWLWQATSFQSTIPWGGTVVLDLSREVEHSLVFLGCSALVDMVLDVPFSLYSAFVIEERHGFNKDLLKSILLTIAIGGPVTAAIISIAKHAGPWLVPGLWAFSLLLSLFFLTIYPVAIAPLFNSFVPLEDGTLKTAIEELASSLAFPLAHIFVVDGSRRSAHSNAYLYGFFGNKRVVLYDTLIQQCGEEEVVAVVAHEMGHWKLSHTLKSFATSQALTLFNFVGYGYVSSSRSTFAAFGFGTQPVIIGFLLFQLITIPISHLLTFMLHVISREYEFQADAFAVSLNTMYAAALRGGLIKLQEENKSSMAIDPLYATYHYSHPPFTERLEAIEKESQAQKKKES